MAMVPFYSRLRELAFAETRSVTTRAYGSLPDAAYGFLRNVLQVDMEYVRRLERHYQLANATDAVPQGTTR